MILKSDLKNLSLIYGVEKMKPNDFNSKRNNYKFLKVPMFLIENENAKKLSCSAKLLYSLFLQRMEISNKNGWVENKTGRLYIIFTIQEIMEKFNCSNKTAIKLLDELDTEKGIGLIERKKQGLCKPNIIYVNDFEIYETRCKKSTEKINNFHSENDNISFPEVKKVQGNYINNNYKNNNNINYSNNVKRKYGVFRNVYLTDYELNELKSKTGKDADNYIDRLSTYMKSSQKKYDDHLATILSWYIRDVKSKQSSIKDYDIEDYEKD